LLWRLNRAVIQVHLLHIIDFAESDKDKADKSWLALLKSNAFYGGSRF